MNYKKLILAIFTSLFIMYLLSGCGRQVFNGNRTSNDTQFIMDYSIFTKTETHEMELAENSVIDVSINNEAGRLDIIVLNPDGEELYRGDAASSGEFSLNANKQGVYKFTVKGNKAKGGFSFKVREQ